MRASALERTAILSRSDVNIPLFQHIFLDNCDNPGLGKGTTVLCNCPYSVGNASVLQPSNTITHWSPFSPPRLKSSENHNTINIITLKWHGYITVASGIFYGGNLITYHCHPFKEKIHEQDLHWYSCIIK